MNVKCLPQYLGHNSYIIKAVIASFSIILVASRENQFLYTQSLFLSYIFHVFCSFSLNPQSISLSISLIQLFLYASLDLLLSSAGFNSAFVILVSLKAIWPVSLSLCFHLCWYLHLILLCFPFSLVLLQKERLSASLSQEPPFSILAGDVILKRFCSTFYSKHFCYQKFPFLRF